MIKISNIKNLVGKEINSYKLISRKRENNRTYYLCHCNNCGKDKWVRSDFLTSSICKYIKQYRFRDITGQKFGKLTAIKKLNPTNNGYMWLCKCDCGKLIKVSLGSLTTGKTASCGCTRSDNAKKTIKSAHNTYINKYIVDDTNLQSIQRGLQINNTSGITGVTFNKSNKKWLAYITFKGKKHYLGTFVNKEDAIEARKEAEEKYFKPILEKYQKGKEG